MNSYDDIDDEEIERMEKNSAAGLALPDNVSSFYERQYNLDADADESIEQQARRWCEAFRTRNEEWLKTTVADHGPDGPSIRYEPVDVGLIPPRPRTYGLVGAEVIDRIWREMLASSPTVAPATASLPASHSKHNAVVA